jgi:hypothetical protein
LVIADYKAHLRLSNAYKPRFSAFLAKIDYHNPIKPRDDSGNPATKKGVAA